MLEQATKPNLPEFMITMTTTNIYEYVWSFDFAFLVTSAIEATLNLLTNLCSPSGDAAVLLFYTENRRFNS